jgi:hypothetical protein
MSAIFERAERPRRHAAYRLSEKWWTWSDEARYFLRTQREALKALRVEQAEVLPGAYPTALVPHAGSRLRALASEVLPLSQALSRVQPGVKPHFLCALVPPAVEGTVVARFLTLLAYALNLQENEALGPAMCVPPSPSPTGSDFALHSDLFPRRRLLVIFDQVSAPNWSGSLLLPWTRGFRLLNRAGPPTAFQDRIRRLLELESRIDGFNNLFGLLYRTNWCQKARLSDSLHAAAVHVQFGRGEGYLIDDRRWLHGRRRTKIGVTRARFRRLVF